MRRVGRLQPNIAFSLRMRGILAVLGALGFRFRVLGFEVWGSGFIGSGLVGCPQSKNPGGWSIKPVFVSPKLMVTSSKPPALHAIGDDVEP